MTVVEELEGLFLSAITLYSGESISDAKVRVSGQDQNVAHYQCDAALALAKHLGKSPRDVAEGILTHLPENKIIEQVTIAGPGFLNIILRDSFIASRVCHMAESDYFGVEKTDKPKTIVVDYSGPNVAKEMHVGHLRSTILGDALVRLFEAQGHTVIRQNHLGDWGTQFGMLIEYILENGAGNENAITELNTLYRDAKQKFDSDKVFAEKSRERVVLLQSGDEESVEIWKKIVATSTRYFETVYSRLQTLLTSKDIRAESFYNSLLPEVITDLEKKNLITKSDGADCVFLPEFGEGEDAIPLIVRKSDGAYLYATTDLAALRYRFEELHADEVVYVTDSRQKQHFRMVFAVAKAAGWMNSDQAKHVAFGSVLGSDGKPFKTRSGEVVRLADLLDDAELRAYELTKEKRPELPEEDIKNIARKIAVGAVKYADLSSDRERDYVFDVDRMLAMEGNTAPYAQYCYARAKAVIRKSGTENREKIQINSMRFSEYERKLLLTLLEYGDTVQSSIKDLKPHSICTWIFEVCGAFHAFYEHCPILNAENEEVKNGRLFLTHLTAQAVQTGLGIVGIAVSEEM